jgi:hypothetical protein
MATVESPHAAVKNIPHSQIISVYDPVEHVELGELMAAEYNEIDISVGGDGYLHAENSSLCYEYYFEELNALCPVDWVESFSGPMVEEVNLHGRVSTPVDGMNNRFANILKLEALNQLVDDPFIHVDIIRTMVTRLEGLLDVSTIVEPKRNQETMVLAKYLMYFYAPLMSLYGIPHLSNYLYDLSYKALDPKGYERVQNYIDELKYKRLLNEENAQLAEVLRENVASIIQSNLDEFLRRTPSEAANTTLRGVVESPLKHVGVISRAKSNYSAAIKIADKLNVWDYNACAISVPRELLARYNGQGDRQKSEAIRDIISELESRGYKIHVTNEQNVLLKDTYLNPLAKLPNYKTLQAVIECDYKGETVFVECRFAFEDDYIRNWVEHGFYKYNFKPNQNFIGVNENIAKAIEYFSHKRLQLRSKTFQSKIHRDNRESLDELYQATYTKYKNDFFLGTGYLPVSSLDGQQYIFIQRKSNPWETLYSYAKNVIPYASSYGNAFHINRLTKDYETGVYSARNYLLVLDREKGYHVIDRDSMAELPSSEFEVLPNDKIQFGEFRDNVFESIPTANYVASALHELSNEVTFSDSYIPQKSIERINAFMLRFFPDSLHEDFETILGWITRIRACNKRLTEENEYYSVNRKYEDDTEYLGIIEDIKNRLQVHYIVKSLKSYEPQYSNISNTEHRIRSMLRKLVDNRAEPSVVAEYGYKARKALNGSFAKNLVDWRLEENAVFTGLRRFLSFDRLVENQTDKNFVVQRFGTWFALYKFFLENPNKVSQELRSIMLVEFAHFIYSIIKKLPLDSVGMVYAVSTFFGTPKNEIRDYRQTLASRGYDVDTSELCQEIDPKGYLSSIGRYVQQFPEFKEIVVDLLQNHVMPDTNVDMKCVGPWNLALRQLKR